eukprot:364481-Pleurochrysis_carterae.AAC.1
MTLKSACLLKCHKLATCLVAIIMPGTEHCPKPSLVRRDESDATGWLRVDELPRRTRVSGWGLGQGA